MPDDIPYVSWFRDLTADDVSRVGGKNASLGEMYRELAAKGVRVPNGFAISAQAYRDMLAEAGAWERLHVLLDDLDTSDVSDLARRAQAARELVYGAGLSETLRVQILDAYHQLREEYGPDLSLAVRSSATAEDLPTASFAGQHETFLNVRGDEMLLDACRRCFASLFLDRAISYRVDQGFDHFKVSLSVGVMKMVRSDLSASGVLFTLDTESGFRDVVFVTGAYGLGENVVQGAVDPDEFYVHKPTFREGHRTVLRRLRGEKQLKMVYAGPGRGATTRNLPTVAAERERFCISDEEVLRLAEYAITIEDHYTERSGESRPMDIEWAKDGIDGELYIVQARPETVASQTRPTLLEDYHLTGTGSPLVTGRSVGAKIASGRVRVVARVGSARRVPGRRSTGRRYHDPRLGAGAEASGGRRDQPRRPHLPRRDRRSRAGHPGGGRNRRRHGRLAERADRDRILRRGRRGAGVRRRGSLRGGACRPEGHTAPQNQHHGESRQPGARFQDELPAQ